jgi:hypothetical protein
VKKRRIYKFIILGLISLFLFLAAGAALFVYFYPKENLRNLITARAEQSLKRKITIKDIDYGFRGIILRDIRLYDGPSEKDEKLAVAGEAAIRFSFFSLLRKQFTINYIHLENFEINIVYVNDVSNIENMINGLKTPDDGGSSLSAKVSTIALKHAKISLINPPEHLRPLAGTYMVDGVMESGNKNDFYVSDCKIIMPEKRGIAYPDLRILPLRDNFEITGEVRFDRASLLWVYTWGKNFTLPYTNFSGDVKNLKITKNSVEGNAKGSSLLANQKVLLANGFCRVNITGETVVVSNLKASIHTSHFGIRNLTFSFSGKMKKIDIPSLEVSLGDVTPLLEFLPADLYGNLAGNFLYENNLYSADFTFKDVGYDRRTRILSGVTGQVKVHNNTFQVQNLPVLVYGQACLVSAGAKDGQFRKFLVNLTSKDFRMKREESKTPFNFSPVHLPIEMAGTVDIENFHYDKIDMSKISATYTMAKGSITVNKMAAQFMGGEVNGRAHIDLSKASPDIDVGLSFSRVKVQNLTNLSEQFSNRLFGVAAGMIDVKFSIDRDFNIFNSLKGKMEFNIDNGKLVNTGIQDGLGIWLAELKYKLKDLEFSKIYGNCSFSGINYNVNSLIFNSKDIRLKLNGYLNKLLEGDLKIDLEFTGNFIKDLPNPGLLQINKYKKGNWYVIPFQAKGKDITDSKNIKKLY